VIKPLVIVAALASAAMPVFAQNNTAPSRDAAAALFGVRENVQQMDISPDGRSVVYVTPGSGRTSAVFVADLASGTPQRVLQSSGSPDRVSWCNFVSNTRLICRFVGQVDRAGLLIPFSRLIAVDTDGKNIRPLGQKSSTYDSRLRQFDGAILDWLPGSDGAVLMARDNVPEEGKMDSKIVRRTDGLSVDRIDATTLKSSTVEAASKTADFFITDGRGNVRIKAYQPQRGGTGELAARVDYHYRLPGSREWKPFSSWENRVGMAPIDIDAGSNSAYALKNLDGRIALYRVKLDGSMETELVYKNDKVDVDDVVRVGRGSRVIGVTYAEDKRSVVYFDPEYRALAAALGTALPNLPTIAFLGSSTDDNKLLLRAGSESDPGR